MARRRAMRHWVVMLRRIFYREAPFRWLSPTETQGIFEAFQKTLESCPEIFYWIHKLENDFLVTDFKHTSMLRYRGLEIVLLSNSSVSYYRLPGAKAGGYGEVRPGTYHVKIRSELGDEYLLELSKTEFGMLTLRESRLAQGSVSENHYQSLQRHPLLTSKFADEMKSTIASGIEWLYQYQLFDSAESPNIPKLSLNDIAKPIDDLIDEMIHGTRFNDVRHAAQQ